jgi:hypothetical protein
MTDQGTTTLDEQAPPVPPEAAHEDVDGIDADNDGGRTARILRLADEEARSVRAEAARDAEAIREQARRDGAAQQAQAQRDAADMRVAALAEAEAIRQDALEEARERRAQLVAEADELVASVWLIAERVRLAAGKDPRELPESVEVDVSAEQPGAEGEGESVSRPEETLARQTIQRRAAAAARQAHRTTEAAEQEAERVLTTARREAEELLARAKAEAERQVERGRLEGERARSEARRQVDSLTREREGILARLAELTEQTAALDL